MWFIGIIVILVLIHFLIIRPLTQQIGPQRLTVQEAFMNSREEIMGHLPIIVVSVDLEHLLVDNSCRCPAYLFEQGRIGFDQYTAWQHLEDQEIMVDFRHKIYSKSMKLSNCRGN